jgi:hypothetical protein
MRHSFALLAILFAPFLIAQSINLKDLNNQFDYVIISAPDLMISCNNFKMHKEELGFNVLVVSTNQVFSQFNSKALEQDNLRDFISFAGTYWKSPKPKYFLLAGDLSRIPNYKYVTIPGYSDTTKTDYYYSVNLYDPDTSHTDFYIGRIAARTNTELTNYFNKVINYENNKEVLPWNLNSLIISDDGLTPTANEGNIFEDISMQMREQFPSSINVKYFFESDTSKYYGSTDSILNYINNPGTGTVFFVGHNNDSEFTHENYFNINDVSSINNGNKYFFVNFLGKISFSDSSSSSLIDQMLFKESGAVAGFNSVGAVYASQGSDLTNSYVKLLYSASHLTLGQVADSIINNSISNQIKQYNIFGDPSIKLKYDITAGITVPAGSIPSEYILEQNFPNPFNPSTLIRFSLPKNDFIQLKIYDLLGNEVAILVNGFLKAGKHEVKFVPKGLGSGIYFYSLKGTDFEKTNKMVLIK